MARSLTLTPTRVEGRKTPWRIWIPARLNSTGKDGDRYYATKREAEQAAAAIEIRKENFGRLGTTLSESQIAIAGKAFQLLGDRDPVALIEIIRRQLQGEERLVAIGGATMEDAIEAHITAETQRLASRLFGEAYAEFLSVKAGRKDKHKNNLRITGDKIRVSRHGTSL